MPIWMAKAKTLLLPKNDQTNQERNDKPLALQNKMLPVDTSCMNQFSQDRFQRNNEITTERAGEKKKVLACLEQL